MECIIFSGWLPGRSVRPMAPAKRVSPEKRTLSELRWKQMEPAVWPGVWMTRRLQPSTISPSFRKPVAGGSLCKSALQLSA